VILLQRLALKSAQESWWLREAKRVGQSDMQDINNILLMANFKKLGLEQKGATL
jgi:hypothetical protein